ncbi:hypothetical protein [Allofranklinella schreckenbergeri]|uniref:hypothetical protein n=1 Tax=Allofranklinella schreckenbergeri TaxID=1076744 RepID=UPI0011C3645F|nr:hypothetical protein [Allofranklinella schreckenbergeri]
MAASISPPASIEARSAGQMRPRCNTCPKPRHGGPAVDPNKTNQRKIETNNTMPKNGIFISFDLQKKKMNWKRQQGLAHKKFATRLRDKPRWGVVAPGACSKFWPTPGVQRL